MKEKQLKADESARQPQPTAEERLIAAFVRMAKRRHSVPCPDAEEAWEDIGGRLGAATPGHDADDERRRSAAVIRRLKIWAVAATGVAAALIGVIAVITLSHKDENARYVALDYEDSLSPVFIKQDDEKPVDLTDRDSLDLYRSQHPRAHGKTKRQQLSTPRGMDFKLILSDGTEVWLNAESTIKFPSAFSHGERRVELEGEAYFKIKKDPLRPFIVQADGIETTVLGTEFNIKNGTVTLVNGSVKVRRQVSPESVVMTPGQQASLIDDKLKVAAADTLPYVYWRDGYLYYDNMTIRDIMRAIGSTYNMTVRCVNSDVLQQHMRFMAERDKGVDAAIDMMNRMGKVRVVRKDDLIIVE